MKSLYQFRLLDELKASDTQVRISDLIGWKDEHQLPKKVEFEKETIVFQNGDGSVFEMAFWSAQNWIMTLLKRGLDENNPPTEKEYNKKTWGNGTKCYITAGAGDFIDKDETGYWNGKQIFEAWVVIKKALEAEGQIDAKRGIKHPTFSTKEEATAYFTEAEKVEWLLVNIAGSTCRWNSTEKEWNALGNADINEEKVLKNSEKIKTLEEKVVTQEQKVGKLEEAGAPGYLSIKWYSKEDIALWDMVVVDNPNVGELSATIMLSVGDIEENQELHIQRIGSWQQLSNIKIPIQKIGTPSDGLLIQVMESKEVTISWKKHWMGSGVVVATATVMARDIPATMTVKDINFSAVKLELGKKYSVVIKRSGNVINNQNFYKIWCFDKRCSSSFELVFWGASPKIRSDFTPTVYAKSSAFLTRVFGKNTPQDVVIKTYNVDAYFSWGYPAQQTYNFTAEANIKQLTWSVGYHHNRSASITITQNGRTFYNKTIPNWSWTFSETFEVDIKPWTFQVTYNAYNSSTLKRSEKLLKWNGVPYTAWQSATIGEQIEAIIYWEFSGKLIGEQIDTTISSSATTWWIPPANAVGYMSILWPDWKKYKIRVYGE